MLLPLGCLVELGGIEVDAGRESCDTDTSCQRVSGGGVERKEADLTRTDGRDGTEDATEKSLYDGLGTTDPTTTSDPGCQATWFG